MIRSTPFRSTFFATAFACAGALSACSGEPESTADLGSIQVAIASVPSDARCVQVEVQGSRTVTNRFDVAPGTSTSFAVGRLPVGLAQVTGAAYATACSAVTASSVPAYVADAAVSVRIDAREVREVLLKLLRNGRLSVGVEFENEVCDQPGAVCANGLLKVQLLGFNDFHGQLSAGRRVANRPVGGAAVLASYLKAASAGLEEQTFIVHAGDHVGASPAASALLQDEPSITFLNLLSNADCRYENKASPRCNLVGTLGNHEFDEGKSELLRLLDGGNHSTGPFLEDPYKGARFPYVSANVVDEVTNKPLIAPYVIKHVRGVPIAFVGAVLKTTPTIVTPTGVAGLKFLDEATAANSYVPELKAAGVRALVLVIHQGGTQTSYTGPTKTGVSINGADINDIVKRLDSEFDVVVSGHAHAFSNALVANNAGKQILVTQAFSASTAYADIDLLVDPATGDVVEKTADVVTTFADVGPGLTPDPTVAALVSNAETKVAPLVGRVVGTTPTAISSTANNAGESAMGNVIADAQRAAVGAQFAFMNPGGIRASLDAGDITWGELFTVQPFGNSLVKMQLTGAQIKQVLEQQWLPPQPFARIMSVSGLKYTWDNARPVGDRVVQVLDAATNLPLDPAALYTIVCNNFMASGGDNFTVFVSGLNQVGGPVDLDALIDWVEDHNPLAGAIEGRITRLN